MRQEGYYYAVTRIRNMETSFLTGQSADAMLRADGYAGCLAVLREHGWTAEEGMSVREILGARREAIWAFLGELEGVSERLDAFRYEHDFNHIKAAIKLQYTQRLQEFDESYCAEAGTLPTDAIRACAAAGNFDPLPERFARPANEAVRLLLQTGSGQLADAVLDRACLDALCEEADRQGSGVLRRYAEMRADIANIAIAVRGLHMNKSAEFFRLAMTEGGSLSRADLCTALAKGEEGLYAYLASTGYAPFLNTLKDSLSYFRAEVENRLADARKAQRHAIGGIDAIYAFVITAEAEGAMVRLLLSAKRNRFPAEFVSGCMRRTVEG